MVSFEVRALLTAASPLLAVATFALAQLASAQDAPQDAQLIERIRTEQAESGPYSVALLDPLTSLGFLYQERGEHALAAAVLERARQVVRANYGLTSLDQAPLLRQQIRSEEALGRIREAWELEQRLIDLVRAHPEDLRTVEPLREIGNRRLEVVGRYATGVVPPQVVLGCFYAPERSAREPGSCDSGSHSVATQALVSDAQRSYLDAVRVMLRHELYSSPDLRDLEMKIVRSSFEHGRYDVGRQSLRRLLAYSVANEEPRASQIEAFVLLADWELMFGLDQVAALEAYGQAFALFSQEADARPSLERIFAPDVPVVLPSFEPNPLITAPTAISAGYIDVSFEITRFGTSRNIEVLAATTAATVDARKDLVHRIARARFRPRAVDGELARAARVTLRYYLATGPGTGGSR